MKEDFWTFKKRLLLFLGSCIITAAVYLFFRYIFPIASPFIIAFLIAWWIEKPVEWLARKLWGKKAVASSLIMMVLAVLICLAVGYLAYMGISEIRALIKNADYYMVLVRQQTARICLDIDGWLGLCDGSSMDFICKCAGHFTGSLKETQGSEVVSKVMRVSVPVLVKIFTVVGMAIVSLISVVYLSGTLGKVRQWKKSTVFYKEVTVVFDAVKKLINVYFKIQLIIIAINSAIITTGLFIIKNPYAVVIGILIGIVDALPIFGTGTVLIPWAVVMLFMKNYMAAAVLISVYVITYFVREIMESKCMGQRLGIAPFTMLMVIFAGFGIYGLWGFILGPVSYCIIKALIIYYKESIQN